MQAEIWLKPAQQEVSMQITVWQNKHNRSQWGWTILISEGRTYQASNVGIHSGNTVWYKTPDAAFEAGMKELNHWAAEFGLIESVGRGK